MLDKAEIKEAKPKKFLGIHLGQGLTWDCQVDSVTKKLSSGIYALRQFSNIA